MNNIGKIPPRAIEIEEAVLGQLMIDDRSYDYVSDVLEPDIFYKESNQKIYSAICKLKKKNEAADIITVSNELHKKGFLEQIGGAYAVNKLTENISSSANIEYHAAIIVDKFKKRQLIKIANRAIEDAYNDSNDVVDTIDTLANNTSKISEGNNINNGIMLYDAALDYVRVLQTGEGSTHFVKTHLSKINSYGNGFGGGTLTIIAGRPGMGKSALTADIIYEQARNGTPVAFFPLEMKSREIAARRIAAETGISTYTLNEGGKKLSKEEWNNIEKALQECKDVPFYIDDDAKLTVDILKAKIRRLHRKGYKVFYIDYLQLMQLSKEHGNDKNYGYGDISRQLKLLSMELDVPIILLSQLSRKVDDLPKHKQIPNISHLRDSGEIEQNADNIIFVVNYKQLDVKNVNIEGEEHDATNLALIKMAKWRHGSTGSFIVEKSKNQMRWRDYNTFKSEEPEQGELPF